MLAQSLKDLPSTVTILTSLPKPAAQPTTTAWSASRTKDEEQHITEASLSDAVWFLGRSLLKVTLDTTWFEEQPAAEKTSQENISIWSGYHSLVIAIIYLQHVQPGLARHH